MTLKCKLFHALLVLWAGLNLTAATAEAQRVGSRESNDHPRVGSRESNDHPRVGSRESNDHPRVGSRESNDHPRVGSREGNDHHREGSENRQSGNYQRPVNVNAFSAAPSFQPAYQPMRNSALDRRDDKDRRDDNRRDRDDDDRDPKRAFGPNPAMWWPAPTMRSRRAATVKARAGKPVAIEAKKPIVAPPEPEVRTWTDITGRYTTVARFSGMVNQSVVLCKLDDTRVEVPVSQLSVADQDWLESRRTSR